MRRRLTALLLAGAVLLTPALAAGEERFPAVRTYEGFSDVPEGQWYTAPIQTCVETGLMEGMGGGQFAPGVTMSVAQAVTIAARLRAALTGRDIPPAGDPSGPWYQMYTDYFRAMEAERPGFLGPMGEDILRRADQAATRLDLLYLLHLAVGDQGVLTPINTITALPDADQDFVLAFYNAGILTGTDSYGTFQGGATLDRAGCAAMVARIVRPELRRQFTPQEKTPEPSYEEELNAALAMKVNGVEVSMQDFVTVMCKIIYRREVELRQKKQTLDWSGATDHGVGPLPEFFLQQARTAVINSVVMSQQAAALGCATDTLAQTLSPDPGYEVLSAYAQGMDYLAAKHILIQTMDPTTGQTVRSDEAALAIARQMVDAMDQNPTAQQFQNLILLYGEDGGMDSSPEGYLFQTGRMVAEFEGAVRALEIGAYTKEPVKSQFGYHVILRLDPARLSELKADYQDAVLEQMVRLWAQEATVTVNTAMLEQVNVKGCYDGYLQALGAAGR